MNTAALTYLIQGTNITVVVGDKTFNVAKGTHMNYAKILKAIKNENWTKVANLVDITKTLKKFVKDKLALKGGVFYWNGNPIHTVLTDRLLKMKKQGFPIQPLIAFLENLMLNPSNVAVNELYSFLEKNELPITSDGHFLAYKRVHKLSKGVYVDTYTKSISNNVGDTPTMPRNRVDDDRRNTCSNGLHFCSLDYLRGSGYGGSGPIMVVKINPKHVVSIPIDYNRQKGRCEQYEVVAKHGKDANVERFDKAVVTKW